MLYQEGARRERALRQLALQAPVPLERELYVEWARQRLRAEQGPTPYERFCDSLQPYEHCFARALYHVDWITCIEPADSGHHAIGLRAVISPLIACLGLTKTEYQNVLQANRYRFLPHATIERRITLGEFARLTEFLQIDERTNVAYPVDLRSAGTERLLLSLNFSGTEHHFVSPTDVDSAGMPFFPADLHAPSRSLQARLFVHTDVATATRVLIPCSEILRTFYRSVLSGALEGAYRRRSLIDGKSPIDFSCFGLSCRDRCVPPDGAVALADRRFVEAEIQAIMLRALRANQTRGYLALEVAPPVRGAVLIYAQAMVYRTGAFKSIFVSRLLSACRPNRCNFPESIDQLRPWPAKREPWQLALPFNDVVSFRDRIGAGFGGDRCESCGRLKERHSRRYLL